MVSSLLNILWVVLGGLVMALGWWLAGLLCAITVFGLPWARSCFVIGNFALWPFGQEAVNRRDLSGRGDLGTGPLGVMGNVLWVCGGRVVVGDRPSQLRSRLLRQHCGDSLRDSAHQVGVDRSSPCWHDRGAGASLGLWRSQAEIGQPMTSGDAIQTIRFHQEF